jgi:hypothetical protein
METQTLVNRLVDGIEPVGRLRPPWIRTAAWCLVALSYVALVVFVVTPRADLVVKVFDWRYLIEQCAAFGTAVLAALAAFSTTIPAHDRRIVLLPLLPLAMWLASLGHDCFQGWIRGGADGLAFSQEWFCFPAIVLVGAVPAIAMAVMLRRGAPLTPHLTAALGGLAAAGLANFGLRLFHDQDASLMVLVWQVGSVLVLTAACASAGQHLLNWRWITGNVRRKALGP